MVTSAAQQENNLLEREKTLAVRKEERLRRLNNLREGFVTFLDKRVSQTGEVFVLALIFFLNFWLVVPFFGQGDSANTFSAPLLPFLIGLVSPFVPYEYGARIWLLAFAIFTPMAWYAFARTVSGRKIVGLVMALVMTLPVGIFLAARTSLGVMGEDGAYIASLTLIPLVCLTLLRFLRFGYFGSAVWAAIGTGLVALTSSFGLMILLIFGGIIAFSEMLLGDGRLKMLRFLVVILLALGFSAFWYNPKFLYLTIWSREGEMVKNTLFNLLPISFFIIPILGIFGFLLFENRAHLQPMFMSVFMTIAFLMLYLGTGISNPLPSRYLPSLGISLAFLVAILTGWLFDFLRLSPKLNQLGLEFLRRQLLAFGVLGLISLVLILVVLLQASGYWELNQLASVLGAETGAERISFHVIRATMGQRESVIGYLLSGGTVVLVTIVGLSLRRSQARV